MRVRNGVAAWMTMLAFVPTVVAEDQTPDTKDQPQAAVQRPAQSADQQQADTPNRDQANRTDQKNTEDRTAIHKKGMNKQAKMQESMAACLAMSNHAEIELARVALDKTHNAEVRALAQQMIDDHTAAAEKLKQFMPHMKLNADQNDQTADKTAAEKKQWANQNHDPMQKLMQKIAKNELAMTKDVLMRYEGQDFDMGYLGQQIIAHTQLLAKLHAMQDEGTPEFQTAVTGMIETVGEHFKHASHLAGQLEGREGRTTRTTANTTTNNNIPRQALSAELESQDQPKAAKEKNLEKAGNRQDE